MNKHIPKKIHIAWKSKDLLDSNSIFIKNCIKGFVDLADGWEHAIYTDDEIDEYLKNKISPVDYRMLKDRHIVEKTDVWRLLKLYFEGGMYVDIDRLCNISINDILKEDTKLVLPTCLNHSFSQDFMCSSPNNPIYAEALTLNLERRRQGHNSTYFLGPQTYFHAVSKILTGKYIDINPGDDIMEQMREKILSTNFIVTYKENPPYDTITYSSKEIPFDHEQEKRNFYKESGLRHWTNEW